MSFKGKMLEEDVDEKARIERDRVMRLTERFSTSSQYVPNDHDEGIVRGLARHQESDVNIARLLHIDPRTLRKHYGEILATEFIKANAMVAQGVYGRATSKRQPGEDDKLESLRQKASEFWLTHRAGWQKTTRHEHTGADGAPIDFHNLGKLSDTELELLEQIQIKMLESPDSPMNEEGEKESTG